jgi:Kef-type K+ transport system membrane component KefB
MTELTQLLTDVFIMFLAAKVAAEIFERVGQPPVIGELLVGALIGPFGLGLVGRPDTGLLAAFHDDPARPRRR